MNINYSILYNIITRLINTFRHSSKIIGFNFKYVQTSNLLDTDNAFHNFTPQTDIHIAFKFVREYLTINVFLLRVL